MTVIKKEIVSPELARASAKLQLAIHGFSSLKNLRNAMAEYKDVATKCFPTPGNCVVMTLGIALLVQAESVINNKKTRLTLITERDYEKR